MSEITYEIIEFNGQPARKYPDGSIRNEKGHMLQRLPGAAEIISSEQASAMGKRRKQKMLQAVEEGVMKATDMANPYEAVARLVEARAKEALKEGRGANDAARIVFEMLDAKQDKTTETVQTQRMEYTIDEETRALLMQIAQMKRESE